MARVAARVTKIKGRSRQSRLPFLRTRSSQVQTPRRPALVYDLLVVGGGLAGIRTALTAKEDGLTTLVLESRSEIGGRARGRQITDILTHSRLRNPERSLQFVQDLSPILEGRKMQLGGYWFHGVGRRRKGNQNTNPFHAWAVKHGFDMDRTYVNPRVGQVFIDGRPATEDEVKDYTREEEEYIRAVIRGQKNQGPKGGDCDASKFLDLKGNFAQVISNQLGALDLSGDLSNASAEDVAEFRSGNDYSCREGMDSVVKRMAQELKVRTDAPVKTIRWGTEGVTVILESGERIRGKRVAITVPLPVLKSGKIKFDPPLPKEKLKALEGLEMGLMNKTFLFFDEPLFKNFDPSSWCIVACTAKGCGKSAQDRRFESEGAVLTNADGIPYAAIVFTGGSFGKKLEARGRVAQAQFALKKMSEVIGKEAVNKHCIAVTSTRWMEWNGGAYSFAKAGCSDCHNKLAQKVLDANGRGRLYFAGEACEDPESGWGGSFAAAYVTGVRAGNAASRDDREEAQQVPLQAEVA